MKLISDIRLYKSRNGNIDGNSLPGRFAETHTNIVTTRLVMKLRETNFSLGDFDHLYINFTPLLDAGECESSLRSVDKYHNFF